MTWVIYVFGSGAAFFLGVGLILVALTGFVASGRRWARTLATLAAVLGCLLVTLSATPLPYWLYAVLAAVTVV